MARFDGIVSVKPDGISEIAIWHKRDVHDVSLCASPYVTKTSPYPRFQNALVIFRNEVQVAKTLDAGSES